MNLRELLGKMAGSLEVGLHFTDFELDLCAEFVFRGSFNAQEG